MGSAGLLRFGSKEALAWHFSSRHGLRRSSAPSVLTSLWTYPFPPTPRPRRGRSWKRASRFGWFALAVSKRSGFGWLAWPRQRLMVDAITTPSETLDVEGIIHSIENSFIICYAYVQYDFLAFCRNQKKIFWDIFQTEGKVHHHLMGKCTVAIVIMIMADVTFGFELKDYDYPHIKAWWTVALYIENACGCHSEKYLSTDITYRQTRWVSIMAL